MEYPSEKDAEMAQKQRRARFKAVFGTEVGQAVLDDLRQYCGDEQCAFRADALQTAFALGKQDVVLFVKKQLKGE